MKCFKCNKRYLSTRALRAFQQKIKEKTAKSLLDTIIKQKESLSENSFNTTVLYLLHYVLMPTTRIVTKVNGENICSKVSIKDSQKSFMLLGTTAQEVEEALQQKIKNNLPIQPLVLITGSLINPEEILVYFDGIKYRIYSIVRAVDICFKLFYVLNLSYPTESLLVWSFIQQFFYKSVLSKDADKKHPLLSNLISELNK